MELLFPNRRNPKTFITSTTLNRALKRMGFLGDESIGFSAHGFRATASSMLNESGFLSDVIERQPAHQERNNVRASYNHATYMEVIYVLHAFQNKSPRGSKTAKGDVDTVGRRLKLVREHYEVRYGKKK